MVQTSSVLLVASAAIYAASPVVGAGLPLAALGKDLLKAAEGGHHSHPSEHAAPAALKKLPTHEEGGKHKPTAGSKPPTLKGAKAHNLAIKHEPGHQNQQPTKGKPHEQAGQAGTGSRFEPGKTKAIKEGHQHAASRLGQRPGAHEAQRNGKEHRLSAQEHGHLHESNRHEHGKDRLGSQKNRLSEHEHGHERLGGLRGAHDSHSLSGERGRGAQRRPGEQGHLGHERLSHPESNRPGREGRLGHEHLEAGPHSRIQSQHGHERLAHPETGRPHVGAPSSRLSSRPSSSRPHNPANQAEIKKGIDELYRLEGRDWDEEDLFIREPMDWEDDLYIRDFDDVEDLYARGEGRKGRHGHKKHGGKKHHHHHKQKGAILAAQEAAAQPEAGPTDPSQATEMGARGWYDDDLLEFAQRSYYDFYDELD